MPQEFHVVRCYACQVFQVQQVKKIPKWQCKMCGEKQSLKKEYGRGTGSDCRRHVQKLNMAAGESSDSHGGTGLNDHCAVPSSCHRDEETRVTQEGPYFEKPKVEKETSKWKTFMNNEEEVIDDDTLGNSFQEAIQHPYLDNAEVTLSRPERQRRGGRRDGGWNSGRKRKRDFDQDTPEYQKPSGQQGRNTPFRNVKPSDVNFEEKVLPEAPHPHYQVAKASLDASTIIDGVKFTEESKASPGDFRMKPSRNPSTTCRETKKVTTKPKPEASSKWGQFLQDDDEEEEEEQEDGDFQKTSTLSQTWSRATPNLNDSPQHHYNDTSYGQLTENPNKPLTFLDGLTKQATSIEVKPQRTHTAGGVTKKHENQGEKMAIFSIEDENLFDFADEW